MNYKKWFPILKNTLSFRKNPQLYFLTFSLALSYIWFKDKIILATGEEGLVFYNASRILHLYNNFWIELGTGYLTPLYMARLPFFYFMTILQSIGWSSWFVQALIFFIMLFVGMYGALLLYRELLEKKNYDWVSIIAALFYAFNLFVVSQVWSRFLITGIMAWAYLPVFLHLVLLFVKKSNKKALILFVITNFLFSYIYSAPAFIFTFWVPAFLIMLYAIFLGDDRKEKIRRSLRSLFIIGLWVVISLWWLYPSLTLASSSFESLVIGNTNIDSLAGVSEYFPISQILFLKQKFLFSGTGVWAYYHNKLFLLINWAILIIVILGFFFGKKLNFYKWGVSLFAISLFIVKGTNFPLGEQFYGFLFKAVPFSGVLRNPYEKFGITFVLIYGLFFAVGLERILNKFIRKKIVYARIAMCTIFFGYFLWPFWTGVIFNNKKVIVPQSYEKMNNQIISMGDTHSRVLHIPLNPGDGVDYNWQQGYSGVEQMHLLFDNPSVARIIHTSSYLDKKHTEIFNAISSYNNLHAILDEMNIRYIVYHDDFSKNQEWVTNGIDSKKLDGDKLMTFKRSYDSLKLYEYNNFKKNTLFNIDGLDKDNYSYRKINSRHYQVFVKNVNKPYELVFKSTFNSLWVARINFQKISSHHIALNYANAWNINRNGSYTIEVLIPVWPWEKIN